LSDNEFVNYKNYFPWFIGLAGLLLLVEWFIPERKRKIA
jgi:Ca-activated chloride channel family protein